MSDTPPRDLENVSPPPTTTQVINNISSDRERSGINEEKENRSPVPVGTSQFATISHSFQLVSKQVNLGVDTVGRIARYLQKLCQAKDIYAKEILKATAAENKGITNGVSDDSMKRFADVWTELKQQVAEEAQQEQEFATKTLQEVVNPLLMFSRDLETKRKTLMDGEAKSTAALQAAIHKLLKCKTECVRILETLSQVETPTSPTHESRSIDESQTSPIRKPSGVSGAKGFFSKFKSQVQDLTKSGDKNKSPEELREKAHQASLAYTQALTELNTRHAHYYTQELPRIFDEMQKLESSRLDILKQHLAKLSTDNLTRVSPTKQNVIQFIKTVENMDTNNDITEYVNHIVAEVGAWVPPDAYTYDLPISPEDILAGKKYTLTTATALAGAISTPAYRNSITSAGPPKSPFGVSIQQCMELQKEQHPLLDYPIIVPILIQHIRDKHGLNTEGLFRITPQQEAVMILRRQIEMGEEDWKDPHDIHVYAALLKTWLRELTEPVIPHYAQAVALGKDPNLDKDFSGVRALFDSLPAVNQKILRAICSLWYDVAANSAVNKMNVVNLSIVVAPCILRNPSHDPVQLMSNTSHESRFVSALIFALAGRDSIEYSPDSAPPSAPSSPSPPAGHLPVAGDDGDDVY